VTVPLPDNWSYDASGSIDFFVDNNLISSIRSFTDYSIADFLSKYGKPSEIWIVYREDELLAPHYLFYIALNYPEDGFMVLYFKEVLHDDKYHLCPYRIFESEKLTDGLGKIHIIDHPVFSISLWNPLDKRSFTEIISKHYPSLAKFEIFKPLNEITNFDINQFMDIYESSNSQTCIEIKQ